MNTLFQSGAQTYRQPLATSIMKTLHKIITIGLLIVSLNLSGQDLRILNTKDLIPISNSFGLDSALNLTTNIPIYYIDPDVAKQLVGLTKNATPSSKIEYFLVFNSQRSFNSARVFKIRAEKKSANESQCANFSSRRIKYQSNS